MAVEESQVYQDLMRLKPSEWTPNAWAVKAGVSRTVWADMRRHGNPSRRTLDKLLKAAGSSLAEFEALRTGDFNPRPELPPGVGDVRSPQWVGAPLPPIPLFASASGGVWKGPPGIELTEIHTERLIAQLARPISLAGDRGTYALTIIGNSMWPRFRPNRRVAISPEAPLTIGDDVAVQVKTTEGEREYGKPTLLLVKELVQQTASHIELRQFNPDITFQVQTNQIVAVHKVLGELI